MTIIVVSAKHSLMVAVIFASILIFVSQAQMRRRIAHSKSTDEVANDG